MEKVNNNECYLNNSNVLHKVTIIIPVYNVVKYLKESIESAINQTYKNLEIILIDDGSNDGSEKICDEYSKIDSRIKVFHQPNMGLSAARNKGLDSMTGEYVAFLDSDDIYHPDFIKKAYDVITQKNVDCVLCNYALQRTTGILKIDNISNLPKRIKLSSKIYSKKEILAALIERKINYSVWNKLYKKELWNNIRFPINHAYEDVITTFDVLKNTNKTYILEEPLLVYRIHDNSISKTFTLKNLKDRNIASSNIQEKVKENIPNIFSEKQYYDLCKNNLFSHIIIYIKNNSLKNSEKDEINVILKNQISSNLKIMDKKNFYKRLSLKEKIIYYFYKRNIRILVDFYRFYVRIRKLI